MVENGSGVTTFFRGTSLFFVFLIHTLDTSVYIKTIH